MPYATPLSCTTGRRPPLLLLPFLPREITNPFEKNGKTGRGGGDRSNTTCSIEFEPVNQVPGKQISMLISGNYHAAGANPSANLVSEFRRSNPGTIQEQ